MPKLLVSDIDGTLIDPQGNLSATTLTALRAWVDQGQTLALATGRNYRAVEKYVQAIQRDMYLILQDGCLLMHYPSGRVLNYHNLGPVATQTALQIFQTWQQSFLFFDPLPAGLSFSFYRLGPCSEGLKGYLRGYQGQYQTLVAPQTPDGSPSKLVTLDTAQNVARLRAYLLPALAGQATARVLCTEAVRLGAWFLEIGSAAASKLLALTYLLEQIDYTWIDVIAVGDAENDVEMIQAAGLGLAMGNASARVKRAADATIGPNSQDGLAQFLLGYGPEI